MFSSSQVTTTPITTTRIANDDSYDSTPSSMAYYDENANDGIYTRTISMETETEYVSVIEEDSQDSGFSSDSFISDNSAISEDLYVATGPIDFAGISSMKRSPDLPSTFAQNLDEPERKATDILDSFCNCQSLRPESSGRRTPLKNITQSCNSGMVTDDSSPISRKNSRSEFKYSRKRSVRTLISQDIELFGKLPQKRRRPAFHRAFSTSELEIQRNYDSSPETAKYSLEVVNGIRPSDRAFRRIESGVLSRLMKSLGESFYERYILIDCRYPFEFDGGHIKGAVNLFDPHMLRETFYPTSDNEFYDIHSKTPIFYCEYSSVRGPNMANALRELDRQLNHSRYPYVDYQEIYVLSEGYRHFYHNVDKYCEPHSYIPMKSKQYIKELQKYSYHQKSAPAGFSIRSRSTYTLVHSKSVNLSPCFCRNECSCNQSTSPIIQRLLGDEFSQISLRSPQSALSLQAPLPFSLEDSPFQAPTKRRSSP